MKKTIITLTVLLSMLIFSLPVLAQDAPDRTAINDGTVNMNAPGVKHLSSNDDIIVGSKTTTTTKPANNTKLTVFVNKQPVSFQGQQPINVKGRVLVPVRGVFEKLGATVTWVEKEKKVTAVKAGVDVALWVGKTKVYKSGKAFWIDQPPKYIKGRVLVPLRFISQSLGAKVDWVAGENAVYIEVK